MSLAQISDVAEKITAYLNRGLSEEDIIRKTAQALQTLIPCDRFSLGLHLLNRFYIYQNNQLRQLPEFFRDRHLRTRLCASCDAFIHARSIIRRNICSERRYVRDDGLIAEGMRSDLIVPLILDGKLVAGTLNFTNRRPNLYNHAHLKTALALTDIIAVLVKHLYAQYEIHAIREITTAVQTSRDLDGLLDLILRHIQGKGYDRVRIYLYDETDQALVGTRQTGSAPLAPFRGLRLPVDKDRFSQQTFNARRPVIYRRGELKLLHREQLQRVLGLPEYEWAELPLIVTEKDRDRIVGKISVDNSLLKCPLDQQQLDRLMVYATQAAIAIRHAGLCQTLNEYLSKAHPTDVYTTTDVAHILGLTENAVRVLARTKHFGARMGNRWTFTPADIEHMKCRTPRGRPRKKGIVIKDSAVPLQVTAL